MYQNPWQLLAKHFDISIMAWVAEKTYYFF